MLPYYEKRPQDFFAFEWRDRFSWSLHLHHQMELIYVEQGSVHVTVDFQSQWLHKGDLAVIFPNCVHGYQVPDSGGSPIHICGMVVSPSLAGEFQESLSQFTPHTPFISSAALGEEAAYAVRQLFRQRNGFKPIIAKSYLQLLLAYIWPVLSLVQDKNHRMENIPARAIQYVMDHYRQPLMAKEVAAHLGITQSHLARIFSQRLHMGFNEYVNQLRVQTAQDLLRSTDRPITDIMMEAGFESQSTFNRAFREIHGVSPREYRRQAQKDSPGSTG